jgi:hypothetical protein
MYPLETILSFLLSGVTRIAPDERLDAICSMLGGLLPQMTAGDIAAARAQVLTQFGADRDLTEEILNLIDGHLALRAIFATPDGEGPRRFCSEPDYEL